METQNIRIQSKINFINNKYPNYNQLPNKIIRSKSKNIYTSKKNSHNSNIYIKPNVCKRNNFMQNKQNLNDINDNFNNPILDNNNNQIKNSDLIQLNLLYQENQALKKSLKHQDELLKMLYALFNDNYKKINSLKDKYYKLNEYLKKKIYDEEEERNEKQLEDILKEKFDEELAILAVDQKIMDEICPNPDKMSYEQLLELEEGLGNVNKGLSKEKINKIPLKPFHKAFFEDNSECIICMENFGENELVKQLPCGHIFHGDCIDNWLIQQKNCPFCKADYLDNI